MIGFSILTEAIDPNAAQIFVKNGKKKRVSLKEWLGFGAH